MTTLAPERTVDEVAAGWRRGLDEPGWENPAGPMFISEYAEADIIKACGITKDPLTYGTVCTPGICRFCC